MNTQIFYTSWKMLSFEDAVKITQSRFVVLKGKVASLHRALINYMLSKQIKMVIRNIMFHIFVTLKV